MPAPQIAKYSFHRTGNHFLHVAFDLKNEIVAGQNWLCSGCCPEFNAPLRACPNPQTNQRRHFYSSRSMACLTAFERESPGVMVVLTV